MLTDKQLEFALGEVKTSWKINRHNDNDRMRYT